MKRTTCFAMISMLALAIPACTAQGPDESDEVPGQGDVAADDGSGDEGANQDVGTAEQAVTSCQWNVIYHYTYYVAPYTYKWDVSYNFDTNKWYVDERRIGGGYYRQYVLTPDWQVCWDPGYPQENITLKYGTTYMNGIHNCLPDGREEAHLPDLQRVLTRAAAFEEWVCFP